MILAFIQTELCWKDIGAKFHIMPEFLAQIESAKPLSGKVLSLQTAWRYVLEREKRTVEENSPDRPGMPATGLSDPEKKRAIQSTQHE